MEQFCLLLVVDQSGRQFLTKALSPDLNTGTILCVFHFVGIDPLLKLLVKV